MSNYYMIVTNEVDYEWDIDNKFVCAGFPKRNKKSVQKMKEGDKIIYYVTKQSKFMAAVEVIGEYFYSDNGFGMILMIYGHIEFTQNPFVILKNFDNGVFIKDIWDDLEFIKIKKMGKSSSR